MATRDPNAPPPPAAQPVKAYVRKPRAAALVPRERLYALIDESNFDATGQPIGDRLIVDTISKAMADEAARQVRRSGSVATSAATLIWHPQVFVLDGTDRRKFLDAARRVQGADASTWLVLTMCAPGEQALTLAPVELGTQDADGEPPAAPITILPRIERATDTAAQALDALARLEGVADSTEQDIVAALPAEEGHPRRVAVYDVGQANCNAVIGADGQPLLYFDMGWPWARTAEPPRRPDLLQDSSPAPVLLSHWDFDHWSFALDARGAKGKGLKVKPAALHRRWIARRPRDEARKLGPSHIGFALALLEKGMLLIWPDGTPSISAKGIRMIACDSRRAAAGLLHDRNNNGLAMVVERPDSGGILLTGDADYAAIAVVDGSALSNLAGMVVPHHGGTLVTPPPALGPDAQAHAVVSAHPNNAFGHPRADVLARCMSTRWQISLTMNAHPDCARITVMPFGCAAACPHTGAYVCRLETFGVTQNEDSRVRDEHDALGERLGPKPPGGCKVKI